MPQLANRSIIVAIAIAIVLSGFLANPALAVDDKIIHLHLYIRINPIDVVAVTSAAVDATLWNNVIYRYRNLTTSSAWSGWSSYNIQPSVSNLAPSSQYEFQFGTVSGYSTPSNATIVTSADGIGIAGHINFFYQVPNGTINIVMVKNGAAGSFDMTGPHTNYDDWANNTSKLFRTGSYTLNFKQVPGYSLSVQSDAFSTSGNQASGTLFQGAVVNVTATWSETPQSGGRLQVNATPAEAAALGGWRYANQSQWRQFGPDGINTGLSAGAYTIQFKDVTGYQTPAPRTVAVEDGIKVIVDVVYFQGSGLRVDISDTMNGGRAAEAGAAWRFAADGAAPAADSWHASGETVSAAAGAHTVEFKPIPGYVTPAPREVTIGATVLTIETTYIRPLINHSTDIDGDGNDEPAIIDAQRVVRVVDPKIVQNGKARELFTLKLKVAGEIPAFGDYDGDGDAEYGAWREPKEDEEGLWLVPGQFSLKKFGKRGDIPVPGDYTGDGRTDAALWRPTTGEWLIHDRTSGKTLTAKLGGKDGMVPVPGNWNGDAAGITEPAVMNTADGSWTWAVRNPAGTWKASKKTKLKFGQSGDFPVPADYAGEGKTVAAIYRAAEGKWLVHQSFTIKIGAEGMLPLAADWAGLGRAIPTVFDPARGAWKSMDNLLKLKKFGKGGTPLGAGK